MQRCAQNILTVGCWNMEGIYEKVNGVNVSKLGYESFEDTVKNFDIICLQETHICPSESIVIPKTFTSIPHCRNISSNNRYFGGMLLLIRKKVRKGIKIDQNIDVDTLKVTLKKEFFAIERNIEIFFTYASPINSCYTTGRSENILEKIDKKILDGRKDCIVMGDLNGRTRMEEDFVRDSSDDHSPINIPCYTKDQEMERNNQDTKAMDEQGKLIIELCKSNSLRILNGRMNGDKFGKYTRYPKRIDEKPSVIDYALCGEDLLPQIFSFSVLPFTGLSDHCCISLNIQINRKRGENYSEDSGVSLNHEGPKLTYDKERKQVFVSNIVISEHFDSLLSALSKCELSETDLITSVTRLNEVILDAAQKTFRRNPFPNQQRKRPNKKLDQKNKAWFTKECSKLRKQLRKQCRDLSLSPFDRQKLSKYLTTKKLYKRTCRKAEKQGRKELTQKLFEVGMNDPKSFWTIVSKMNNWDKNKTDETDHIEPQAWKEYFEKLLNKPTNDPEGQNSNNNNDIPTFDPILDGIITLQELREALHQLKDNKAPGPDKIQIEYLKAFGENFAGILLKIIRQLFSRHIYPPQWNANYLKPIYKKDDRTNPDNYRGLAIGSALAKLFSMILLKRLVKYIEKTNIISPNQIGFMINSRTSDHIFLLQTIIEKVVKKNKKKLFCAFIDFKKAYDTVDREKLFQRLRTLGINGTFLKNIMALYEKPSYNIKLKEGYLDPIFSNLGLKQGCPLSPMLFNLYIDDVNSIFDPTCDPVHIQNETLYHFLYADDLVLVSTSAEGLQKSLDKLAGYSKIKSLTINEKKSKTMIFNLQGRLLNRQFKINGKTMENVKSFPYLGFEITPSGTVKHAMNTMIEKAKKALRPLYGVIAKFNLPTKVVIKLFHTYVAPIILYNAENWSILSDKKLQNFNAESLFNETSETKPDIVHRSILKFLLGLNKSAPNIAVYGDTREIPISLKGYRLMLNYWKRLTTLPKEQLASKALAENVTLRTNWIQTIEKLLLTFNLLEVNDKDFKAKTLSSTEAYYISLWKQKLENNDSSRLKFYKTINPDFQQAKYIELPYEKRKMISKLRCSNHDLEIEKGRHREVLAEMRYCNICRNGTVEDETHFLSDCEVYQPLREHYEIDTADINSLINTESQAQLYDFLKSMFQLRTRLLNGREYV